MSVAVGVGALIAAGGVIEAEGGSGYASPGYDGAPFGFFGMVLAIGKLFGPAG